jgi:hypothetical protein
MPTTMPMKNSGLAAALSPALEAALVDGGWMPLSMLVIIPPRPPPFLELDEEVGLLSMDVVVASAAVVARPEVALLHWMKSWKCRVLRFRCWLLSVAYHQR